MIARAEERDVPTQLAHDRPRRRREPGDSPYPVEYTRDIADYDNWESLFFRRLCRGFSMHPFETPPARVLDLGCGSGAWIMQAAEGWPDTHFVGLDMKDIQPDLDWLKSLIESEQIARRVKWVHANFLDRWPLAPAQFDYVRICKIGLGVPEDEWPDIFEEVNRVLKPGGILDIVEEDLIFPAGPPPPPPHFIDSGSQSLRTSDSSLSSKTSSHHPSSIMRSRPSQCAVTTTSTLRSSHTGTTAAMQPSLSLTPSGVPPSDFRPDPRDHSRLRASWEALIARRFLASNPTSILSLHLSAAFARIITRPQLRIPLPPNSARARPLDGKLSDIDLTDDEGFAEGRLMNSSGPYLSVNMRQPTSQVSSLYERLTEDDQTWIEDSASMHLARVVKTIEGCQEAIWHEYQELYAKEPRVGANSIQKDFQMYWDNWLYDMSDRMGMRGLILRAGWAPPPDDPDHGPDWRKWRNGLSDADVSMPSTPATDGRKNSFNSSMSSALPVAQAICRSTRGFTCFKSLEEKK